MEDCKEIILHKVDFKHTKISISKIEFQTADGVVKIEKEYVIDSNSSSNIKQLKHIHQIFLIKILQLYDEPIEYFKSSLHTTICGKMQTIEFDKGGNVTHKLYYNRVKIYIDDHLVFELESNELSVFDMIRQFEVNQRNHIDAFTLVHIDHSWYSTQQNMKIITW